MCKPCSSFSSEWVVFATPSREPKFFLARDRSGHFYIPTSISSFKRYMVAASSSATGTPSSTPSCCIGFARLTATSNSIAFEDFYQFRRQSCPAAQFHGEPLCRRHGIFGKAIVAWYFRGAEADHSTHSHRAVHCPTTLPPAIVIACNGRKSVIWTRCCWFSRCCRLQ